MLLRRSSGFVRYAISCQYHGSSFLGFVHQGNQEDQIQRDGTDLRGYRSVEGRLREALKDYLGSSSDFDNIQVSSRTDRGVHALKNTFHVDILHKNSSSIKTQDEMEQRLQRGLNYFLGRQVNSWHRDPKIQKRKRQRRKVPASYAYFSDSYWARYSANDELKILSVKQAPDFMDNPYSEKDPSQPPTVDWNARFSATERTYVYRLLCYSSQDGNWSVPFEWDRSWRIRSRSMNYKAMEEAALSLEGRHDFSSFRTAGCQRKSPVVTMKSVKVHSQPYGPWNLLGGHQGLWRGQDGLDNSYPVPQLVTIHIVGNSFLYRQVRNMVGCLAQVGTGKMDAGDVQQLLEQKDRRKGPTMAPAHGLFLADVKHGDFHF
ncbi:MAG: hypothetical protein SGBAC_006704 [Bacillariaceae sp.]